MSEINLPARSVASQLRAQERVVERPGARVGGGPHPAHGQDASSLPSTYLRTVFRHRKLLVLLAIAGGLLGWLSTLPKPAIYRAHTSLDIQALNESFMNLRAVDPTEKMSDSNGESFLQTEIKLLQSEALLTRVVTRLHKPGAKVPPPTSLPWPFSLTQGKPLSRDAMLADISHHVTAKPIGMTRLVEIDCDSTDAKLAAEFCNTLASEFVIQDLEVRFESAQQTGEFLSKQLTEVRTKLQASEQQLQNFAQSNGLLMDDTKGSVAQDRLRLLQNEMSQAQADRVAREAQYKVGTSAPPDSLPAVLDDEPSRQYQIKLAELRRQYAELSTTFTPDSPKVQKVEAQIKALEDSMQKERENLIGRLRNEFTAAEDREHRLTAAYGKQEQVVSVQGSKTAQLNMLQREVESGRQLYTALLQRVKEAGFASAMKASPIRVVDRASAPLIPIGPRRLLTAGVGFVLGALLGVLLALFRERTDRHFRRPGDVSNALAIREFGVIPSSKAEARSGSRRGFQWGWKKSGEPGNALAGRHALEFITWTHRRSLMAEAYRSAMSSILFSSLPDERRSILVTSPMMGEGKTTLVSNLGIALAQTARRVILVDGDLRMPRLHSIFDVGNNCGLKNVLRGDHNAATCPLGLLAQPTVVPNLFVLPCGSGPEDPAELLHSQNLAAVLKRLESEFDVVLIDSPPLLHLADARTLAQLARGTVLVLRAGVATQDSGQAALALLEGDDTQVLGCILNDFDPHLEALYGYYSDYYRYSGKATA